MKKGLIISGSIVALLVIAYFGYNWYKNRKPITINQQPTSKPNGPWQNNITVTGTNMQPGGDYNVIGSTTGRG